MRVLIRGEVYAHTARGLLFDGRSLTLVDLAPSTIWSSATPSSGLGYLPTGAYLDLWARRARRLARPDSCRVRGTLALLDPDAQLAGDAVLTLGNPRITAPGLTYDAEVLHGLVPAESGACVLFLEWDTAPTATTFAEPEVPHQQRRSTR
ncbi:MAG TPA: hypothetical protein VLQ92_11995 [Candidatus Limnocylindrales bacterium]|nr:hypothetical protein [Candidatus Limnocylindrales bacterium]